MKRSTLPTKVHMSFGDAATRRIHDGWLQRGLPSDVQQEVRMLLRLLQNIDDLTQLRGMPRLRLRRRRVREEAQYALVVSRVWELRFGWHRGAARGVALVERTLGRPARAEASKRASG
jgi:plasmid maintenance system killer protein